MSDIEPSAELLTVTCCDFLHFTQFPGYFRPLCVGVFWGGFVCLCCVLKYPGFLPIIALYSSTVQEFR